MKVRAKYKCTSVDGGNISLSPVVGGSPENDKFFKATPSGSFQMTTVNDAAAKQFEVGKSYYIDITAAD